MLNELDGVEKLGGASRTEGHLLVRTGVQPLSCQVAVKKMGHPCAEVARFLGVTTSAVIRVAGGEESSELEKYFLSLFRINVSYTHTSYLMSLLL